MNLSWERVIEPSICMLVPPHIVYDKEVSRSKYIPNAFYSNYSPVEDQFYEKIEDLQK